MMDSEQYYQELVENSPSESCPNCGETYDTFDHSMQVCSSCWWDSNNNQFVGEN